MRRGLAFAALLACQCTNFIVDPPGGGGVPGAGSGGMSEGGGGAGGSAISGAPNGGQAAQRPKLQDDVYTLLQGESLSVPPALGVLSNDVPLKLSVRGAPRLLSAVPAEFTGRLVVQEDGSFEFQPEARFFGVYGLEYTVQNESGQSAVGKLWFRVLPKRITLDVLEAGLGGYVLRGSENGGFGAAIAPAGDIDLDGRADLLIGAPDTSQGKGAAFLVYGKDDLSPIDVLSSAPPLASGNYTIFSGEPDDNLGVSVAGLGDVDRDGTPDLALGAANAGSGKGRVYIVAGRMFTRQVALPDPGSMVIEGDAINQDVGRFVGSSDDINGDGLRDILINSNNLGYGWLHAIFGGSGVTGPVSLLEVAGLHLRAAVEGEVFPSAAASVKDFDGDGLSELAIASESSIVVVRGAQSYPEHTGMLQIDGKGGGYRLQRSQAGEGSVAALGDVNGDAIPDFGYCDGQACRVIIAPPVTLANAWEMGGFGRRTTQVQMAGGADFDADGFADIVLAEPSRVSVVYGKAAGFEPVNVAELGFEGYDILPGHSGAMLSAVAVIGDVNRDGAQDLAISDVGWEDGSGRVYVVLGVPRIVTTRD